MTMENPRTKAKHGREDGRKKEEEEDGAAAGARPDIRTDVRIIRAQPDHPDPPPDHPGNCAEDT